MLAALIFKILHVFVSFWFVTGLIGRWVTMKQAENSRDIHNTQALLQAAGRFERQMAIPGSMAVLLLGIITAIVGHYPLLGFIQGSPTNWLLVSILLYLSIIPVIRFVFLPRAKVFDRALEEAVAQGEVTQSLTRAFHDPATRAAHIYEIAVVAAIIFLMVVKPF